MRLPPELPHDKTMPNFDADQAPATASDDPHDSALRNMRQDAKSLVLIIDDTPASLLLMQAILVSAGYEVLTASSGLAALQLAQAAQPQLILLDVKMPGMDGLAMAARN